MSAFPNDLLDAARAICLCGHNRAVHCHGVCLVLICGQLCRCVEFFAIEDDAA
jgi:hypothetical protein